MSTNTNTPPNSKKFKIGDIVVVNIEDDVYPFEYPPKGSSCSITNILEHTFMNEMLEDNEYIGYEIEYLGKVYQLYEWDLKLKIN